ncbi:hypothetical protein BaRGS_00025879 [Batillaria attramentaria]|uniref:Uncharacterized protein n=1 Tax=Batillaria attramentaria TaxID=370345 RepID=A0ABD0K787_9CAEN
MARAGVSLPFSVAVCLLTVPLLLDGVQCVTDASITNHSTFTETSSMALQLTETNKIGKFEFSTPSLTLGHKFSETSTPYFENTEHNVTRLVSTTDTSSGSSTYKDVTAELTSLPSSHSDVSELHPGYETISMSSSDTTNCLLSEDGNEYIRAYKGTIEHKMNVNPTLSHGTRFCAIYIEVPLGLVVEIKVLEFWVGDKHSTYMWIKDTKINSHLFLFSLDPGEESYEPVLSFSNEVTISYHALFGEESSLLVNFTAVPESARPQLELRYTSPTTGYVQTPGWAGQDQYPMLMDSKVRVDVPPDNILMISFEGFDLNDITWRGCYDDKVVLYLGGDSRSNKERELCHPDDIRGKEQFETNVLYVRFFSDDEEWEKQIGFKLVFSFHNYSELPQELTDGKWNCSVPYFSKFHEHFPCNLVADCENGEDELKCPYTNSACGQGRLFIGERCYIYVKPEVRMLNWNEAAVMCLEREAILVSFNTPEEMHNVGKLLRKHDFYRIFIGLQSYKDVFMWTDGTMAYHVSMRGAVELRPICGYFGKVDFYRGRSRYRVSLDLCDEKFRAHVLCEVDNQPTTSTEQSAEPPTVVIPKSTTQTPNIAFVQCPEGHLTHAFLACDIKSACFKERPGVSATCRVPLSPLPPSFTCANGIELVPYTLVCNYRSECNDGSDEDFCVFPPCDAEKPVKCGNQQVSDNILPSLFRTVHNADLPITGNAAFSCGVDRLATFTRLQS